MTYNFDPDRWYDNEIRNLDLELKQGSIDAEMHAAALDALDRRYNEMIARLDGTYRING